MQSEELPYVMAAAFTAAPSLREMMEDYGPDVWNYAFFLTRSREMADDISQEVFLKAYRSIGKYRGDSTLKTWLLTITRNTSFSFKRSSFWKRFVPLGDHHVQQTASAEHEAFGKAYTNRIWELIMSLPDKHREVLVLDLHHGFSIAETAKLLGIAEGTVKSRLSRARDKIRQAIKEENR